MVYGYTKSAGNLEYWTVNRAGSFVPHDQPQAAYQLFKKFIAKNIWGDGSLIADQLIIITLTMNLSSLSLSLPPPPCARWARQYVFFSFFFFWKLNWSKKHMKSLPATLPKNVCLAWSSSNHLSREEGTSQNANQRWESTPFENRSRAGYMELFNMFFPEWNQSSPINFRLLIQDSSFQFSPPCSWPGDDIGRVWGIKHFFLVLCAATLCFTTQITWLALYEENSSKGADHGISLRSTLSINDKADPSLSVLNK